MSAAIQALTALEEAWVWFAAGLCLFQMAGLIREWRAMVRRDDDE